MPVVPSGRPGTSPRLILEEDGRLDSTSTRAAFLSGLGAAFSEAAQAAGGVVERTYEIAGQPVLLRFAGTGMVEKVHPAFAHLETSPTADEVGLRLYIWDSATTGVQPTPLPEVASKGQPPGAIYHHQESQARLAYIPGQPALSFLDTEHDLGWYWVGSAAEMSFWEQAAPLRQLVHWWMASRGIQQVHGGAVGTAHGGVLIVGKPGSGKSTTSLAALESSLRYAGDDYVLVASKPSPWVHSLYCSGKLDPDHLRRFPSLLPAIANADRLDTEKAMLFVHEHFPHKTVPGFPLRALLLPRITGRSATTFSPASKSAALMALAPSTIIQLHTAGRDAMDRMTDLVKQIPCYNLELGTDIAGIAPVMSQFLDQWRDFR
jgi:hypothetical protein